MKYDLHIQEGERGCRAIFSGDLQYRYYLERSWDGHQRARKSLGVIMLNPSTADAFEDDATIRWLIGYAKRYGYNHIGVANLFAYRATDPDELKTVKDPEGPYNREIWRRILRQSDHGILCGWGAKPIAVKQAKAFWDFYKIEGWSTNRLLTIRKTNAGMPYHPLYQKHDLELKPWSMP